MATSDEVLTDVLLLCGWPALTENPPLGSTDLLLLADHVIKGQMWPDVLAAQGDYYLQYFDHSITSGKARYRLPRLAFGPIKDVLFIDDGDDEDDAESVPFMNVEEMGYAPRGMRNRARYLAFIDGDFLGITPIPTSTSGTLRIRYYRRPNKLTLVANARQTTGVVTDVDSIVVGGSSPASIFTAGSHVDVISEGNAHQVLTWSYLPTDYQVDSVTPAGSTFVILLEEPHRTEVRDLIELGDWVALQGFTPVVQVPESMIPLLVETVALRALHHEGDKEGFARVAALSSDSARKALGTLDPRSEAEPKRIVPRDTPLRIAGGFRGRGW